MLTPGFPHLLQLGKMLTMAELGERYMGTQNNSSENALKKIILGVFKKMYYRRPVQSEAPGWPLGGYIFLGAMTKWTRPRH